MDYREGLIAPPFVKLKEGATDTTRPESWDGWCPDYTGDAEQDYKRGVGYCDIALIKVLATENPAALTFPLSEMMRKLLGGEIVRGNLEKGFMDRLVHLASERLNQLKQN